MDGLDIYIDDYTQPDPIPPEMLEQLLQTRHIFNPPQTEVNAEGHVVDVADDLTAEESPTAGAAIRRRAGRAPTQRRPRSPRRRQPHGRLRRRSVAADADAATATPPTSARIAPTATRGKPQAWP